MFIRPVGVKVSAASRPAGHPLLRGLLRRAAGAAEWTQGEAAEAGEGPAEWMEEEDRGVWGEPEPEPEPEEEEGEAAEAAAEGAGAAEAERRKAPETAPSSTPDTPQAPAELPPAGSGLAAELMQLAALTREGLLTPEEFTSAKSRLLRG
ncbi:hypothetical protein ABZZ17_14445 [Streptomyces sp. NPDC006512]|uniref:hypothetical protein n=1 Tax=Streptomyces sp. NPDC006512 TaxID=3154307 RepID=UPI0033B9FB1D